MTWHGYSTTDIFPLKPCQMFFYDDPRPLQAFCPNQAETVVSVYYPGWRSPDLLWSSVANQWVAKSAWAKVHECGKHLDVSLETCMGCQDNFNGCSKSKCLSWSNCMQRPVLNETLRLQAQQQEQEERQRGAAQWQQRDRLGKQLQHTSQTQKTNPLQPQPEYSSYTANVWSLGLLLGAVSFITGWLIGRRRNKLSNKLIKQ